ncbi:MAG: helix-turn-helix transcriptional regulator [Selenomonadaceae bacterium]|nr:helix-turn-helix transcriptional regulator [Selenomonadaceae bacterium]
MEISQALANFRKKAGVSQYDVAAKIGVRRSVYARYELGINIPSATLIKKIAVAYNVSTDYLMGLAKTPNPKSAETINVEIVQTASDLLQTATDLLNKAIKRSEE